MNDRIRELRTVLKMNQTDFGSRIGVKQGSVAGYESGARTPLDSVVLAICREFNVNEEWLRTGKGSMFNKKKYSDLAYEHFGYIMENASTQKKAVLSALVEMMYQFPDDKWDYVFNQFEKCLEEANAGKEEKEEEEN